MFHTLPVRGRRSHLVWPWEKSSVKIWPLPILDLYGQYVYQMKAENILNSNLTLISKICCIKVGRSQLFMISPHFQWEIFFRNANFLKIFINTPQFFFHSCVHKIINSIYTNFGTPTLTTDRMPSGQSCLVSNPPLPTNLRVNNI